MYREDLIKQLSDSYRASGEAIYLGAPVYNGEIIHDVHLQIPLRNLNRHGLIAGATGTGKTVTLQLFAENLSHKGVPVLLMDLKGDLSGMAMPGRPGGNAEKRLNELHQIFSPAVNPVEFLTLSKGPGVRLRATVSEFGPVLLSRILSLNDTQGGILSILFKYADDNELPLLDLKDLKQLIQHAGAEAKKELQKSYGNINPSSLSTILRKIIALEGQQADLFFGEKSFEVDDLVHVTPEGKGTVSIVRLHDMQDKPRLFSTFMLGLLAEIYDRFPEQGDLEKPRLCIFIEEAHLVFSQASQALREQIETIVRLIRSKGVGIFFVTQHPNDIPDPVLAQLGLKIQHALRAFTEKDRKAIKKAAENYPSSDYYRPDQLITQLGTGQALLSALDERGVPTALAAVHLAAPLSRIGTLTEQELAAVISASRLVQKYSETIDRESAYELLTAKMQQADPRQEDSPVRKTPREKPGMLEKAGSSAARQLGRTLARELTRGLLGVLGIGTGRRRRGNWF